ncbi:MAG: 23S rRNA (guanosine(2251)-2'-O)-methyltransferase RlmB [Acidobacteria bacterium RIFCSPLOWO2_02_FULL_67_21]|nr:MAG: 23S rRNA (guanosine(2251)-2'-O)-methyltransferase RlmB [Acidobacteria bacterium RIFCSPLOWO2_02_FULL_67_21]
MIIYGINPVLEALRAGRVREVRVGERPGARLQEIVDMAEERRVPIRRVQQEMLDRDARHGVHQGVVAMVDDPAHYSLPDLVRSAGGAPLLVVLDGVEDPQNVGAILRTVDAAGADGLVVQSRRSAARGGAAAKASAGAIAHVRVAEVVNIARALEELKGLGVWTVGLAGDADMPYDAVDLTGPIAIVLGAEGAGLRRMVRERCDFLVAIPMQGHVGSVNVSVAAGVTLFEAVRQRRLKGQQPVRRTAAVRSEG